MYDLNDLVQNLSTSRFTFLRTLWSNQWHLSTVSWVQKALLVIRIALRGLTIGWGQPLFIFALKWLHQYTASLKMPNEKIRHGIACTMLHQFCTVQLSIIKSWLCFVFDVRCSSTSRERPKQYIKREIPHAGHHFAGLGNKDSSSTAVGASGFGGIAWSSVCCASVSMFHHCHTPRQCCFFTVLLMLLDKVREDASGVTDIKIRNAATSSWLKCFCLSEDSSLKTLTMETVQLDKTLSMIESSSSFGVHRLQACKWICRLH